jgi:hypothetical protein
MTTLETVIAYAIASIVVTAIVSFAISIAWPFKTKPEPEDDMASPYGDIIAHPRALDGERS